MNQHFNRFKGLITAAVIAVVCSMAFPIAPANAVTPNVAVGAGQVAVIPILVSGQRTASVTAVSRFTMPFPCVLLGVTASARASGGTTPTLTVDLMAAGVSVLSAPVAVTAGAVSEATVATAAVADEAAMTVNLAIGGTTPTWDDVMVFITVARR